MSVRWTLLSHTYSSRSGSVNKELYVGIFRMNVHLLVFTGDEQFHKIIQSTLRRTILDSYTWLNYFMILRRPLLLAPPTLSDSSCPFLAPPTPPGSSCPSHPLLALPIPDYPCEPVGTVDDSHLRPRGDRCSMGVAVGIIHPERLTTLLGFSAQDPNQVHQK